MLNSESILSYLSMIANQHVGLNIIMHFIVLGVLLSLCLVTKGWLRNLLFWGGILVLNLSVTINALVFGNPFHLVTFTILAGVIVFQLVKRDPPIERQPNTLITLIAGLFILTGFWYPEFTKANLLQLVIMSPVGILPCPTLLTTLGLLVLVCPCVNKPLLFTAVLMGIIYGLIGTFMLGVYLDLLLVLLAIFALVNRFGLTDGERPPSGVDPREDVGKE
ncbi:MAG TPA: hypothetical protein VHS59_14220 [Bacillota bacterium]|nr:hypothetical protein [Bacillota bacterium]